jgi:uncharacterized protein
MARSQILDLLPGFNCGECGLKSCREFASSLVEVSDLKKCPPLQQERFKGRSEEISGLLALDASGKKSEKIIGVIDGLKADFALAPLPGEPSCREDLHPFDVSVTLRPGDVFKYRPLGCPVAHFAKVLKCSHGVATVHLVGPVHLLDGSPMPEDVGICMVAGFEGVVSRGRMPDVGETVRFLPEHCMMQKVHSGVIVHSEGKMVRIEGIDLKVW